MRFQSTHPHGVRPEAAQAAKTAADVSIHAPAWGATGVIRGFHQDFGVSIHAPAWGATLR